MLISSANQCCWLEISVRVISRAQIRAIVHVFVFEIFAKRVHTHHYQCMRTDYLWPRLPFVHLHAAQKYLIKYVGHLRRNTNSSERKKHSHLYSIKTLATFIVEFNRRRNFFYFIDSWLFPEDILWYLIGKLKIFEVNFFFCLLTLQ